MIRVYIQIREEASALTLEVRAQSIEQAVRLVGAHFPGSEAEVLFPIDPQNFFCADPVPAAELALKKATLRRAGNGASWTLLEIVDEVERFITGEAT